MTLRELANRVSGHLARGTSPEDCSSMTDRELWKLAGLPGPEDLTETEARLLELMREELIADPHKFAADWLALPEGHVDKDLMWGALRYLSRVSIPIGDRDADAAVSIAGRALENAGVKPWYEEGRDRLP